jgi:hypothetical protein
MKTDSRVVLKVLEDLLFDEQREATSNKKMQLDNAKTIEGKID